MRIKTTQPLTRRLFMAATYLLFAGGFIYALHPLAPDDTSALSETTTIEVDGSGYPISISSTNTVNITANNNTESGTYYAAKDTITVTSTKPYSLTIAASTSDTDLHLASDNTKTITTTDGTYSKPTTLTSNTYGYAVTNTDSSCDSSTTPGCFSQSYSIPTPSSTSKWAALPAITKPQVIHTNNTGNATNEKTIIYYGAYLNSAVPAGTYTGSVTYSATAASDSDSQSQNNAAIHPASGELGETTPLTIVTTLNTLTDVGTVTVTIGDSTCTNVSTSTSTGVLVIDCTVPSTLSSGYYTVVATVPQYGKTYTITNGFHVKGDLAGVTTMQDDNIVEACESVDTWENTNETYILTDTRDNKTYKVRKLADNRCWMVQNLRIINKTITSSDSDVSSDFTIAKSSTNWARSEYLQDSKVYDTGDVDKGVYYNWYTATAGTGYYNMEASADATSSICPKGWHLPSNNTGEFSTLFTSSGFDISSDGRISLGATKSKELLDAPFSLTTGGYQYSGVVSGSGDYWTATNYGGDGMQNYARILSFSSPGQSYAGINVSNYTYKYEGWSVRCILGTS